MSGANGKEYAFELRNGLPEPTAFLIAECEAVCISSGLGHAMQQIILNAAVSFGCPCLGGGVGGCADHFPVGVFGRNNAWHPNVSNGKYRTN
jgi:hypothetical protein